MGIKRAILLIAVALLLQQSNCSKPGLGLDCAQTKYNFGLAVKAYPDSDSINIGDTIWFEVNSPTTLPMANEMIDYSKAENLGGLLSFDRLSISNEFTEHSANKFSYLLKEGRETTALDPAWERNYLFAEKNGRYLFLLGIVAKEKGVYSIVFSDAANVYRSNDKCTKARFIILFEDTNQHYPLNPFYVPGTNPRGGDFYFVVK